MKLNKEDIIKNALTRWNSKSDDEKIKASRKYKHLFNGKDVVWNVSFDKLTKHQQIILIKGELIRTYDSLSNIDKTIIKKQLSLTEFSSKWYKLSKEDKNTLLKQII